jgi:hypothetical protein
MLKIATPFCSFCDISGLCRPNWIHQTACLMVKTGSLIHGEPEPTIEKKKKLIYFLYEFFRR